MNKRQFITRISWSLWVNYESAAMIVNTLFGEIENSLLLWQEVNISWFWKFMISNRKSKTGINPKTKEPMNIPWYSCPTFKAGKTLKIAVKAKFNS